MPKSSILLAGTGYSIIKIDYSGYQKSLISRINKVVKFMYFLNKISL